MMWWLSGAVRWGGQRLRGRKRTVHGPVTAAERPATTVMTMMMTLMIVWTRWSIEATKSIVRSGRLCSWTNPSNIISVLIRPTAAVASPTTSVYSSRCIRLHQPRWNSEIGKIITGIEASEITYTSCAVQRSQFKLRTLDIKHRTQHKSVRVRRVSSWVSNYSNFDLLDEIFLWQNLPANLQYINLYINSMKCRPNPDPNSNPISNPKPNPELFHRVEIE